MSAAITVVIPTFNRADLLSVALKSALDQSFQDFGILVADDASTDHTGEVIRQFHDGRIHYHRHTRNVGLAENWHFVLTTPQTEFIAPLADDDCFLPNHLETGISAIQNYPQAAYYTCPAEYFGDAGISGLYRPSALPDTTTPLQYVPPERAVDFLGIDNPGPVNCMICRHKALHADLYWGPGGYLPHDLLLMTQLMAQGGFVFGNRPMARFRIHAGNVSIGTERKQRLRFNVMAWYGIRWLADFLLGHDLCTLDDIERHGTESQEWNRHVIPMVLALASGDSPAPLQRVARRIFAARPDIDRHSRRFQMARQLGFWTIPWAEKLTQVYTGWAPPAVGKKLRVNPRDEKSFTTWPVTFLSMTTFHPIRLCAASRAISARSLTA